MSRPDLPEGEHPGSAHEGTPTGDGLRQAVGRKGSFIQTLKAVAWSFFGVRKGRDLERDAAELNPLHLAVAGVLLALVFIGGLLLLINGVLASGAAI